MTVLTCEALVDEPCPRVEITISGLGLSPSTVSLWRIEDGVRSPVRGARRVSMVDADFVTDYDAPLGRPISYELEVIASSDGSSRTASAPVTLESDSAWIMDPLMPQSAVAVRRSMLPSGEATFEASAMATFDYAADAQLYRILGSDKPMAMFGQRLAAAGVDLTMVTNAVEQNARLKALLSSSGQFLIRAPLAWTDVLPGACFAMVANVSQKPLGARRGSPLTVWSMTADVISAPTIKVLTATFSYGDVEMMMDSYQQKQDLMVGKSYLDDLKNPVG